MANDTEIQFLKSFPLLTSDAAALQSDIVPQGIWQPTKVLRTDPDVLLDISATALAAAGDVYRVMISAPSAMPDTIFYPIALSFSFVGLNVAFWEDLALYSIVPPVGTFPLQHAWRSFQLDTVRSVFNGATVVNFQSGAPAFEGFPPTTVEAIETTVSTIGGLQFTVGTFQAAEKTALRLSVDARWLGFPRALARAAGFYMPRMFFKVA